jgi:hypothetical protein
MAMNHLDLQDRTKILACLVEGNGIRATCRMTGAAKGTVIKLLADAGAACKAFHDRCVRNVPSKRVECGEIWSFCYAKEKNVPAFSKKIENLGHVGPYPCFSCSATTVGFTKPGFPRYSGNANGA